MNKNIYFLAAVFVFLGLLIPIVFSDSLSPGYKSVSYCIKFNNLNEYSEYSLFAVCDTTMPETYVLNDIDGCYGMYKFCNFKVCAIEKTKVPTTLNLNRNAEITGSDLNWVHSNISNNNIICKDLNYRPMTQVKAENPITKVVDVMMLPNFTNSDSNFTKVKIIYTYTGGVSEEIPYTTESRPVSKYASTEEIKNIIISPKITSNEIGKNIYFGVIISLIAIIIISTILIIRKNKKKDI